MDIKVEFFLTYDLKNKYWLLILNFVIIFFENKLWVKITLYRSLKSHVIEVTVTLQLDLYEPVAVSIVLNQSRSVIRCCQTRFFFIPQAIMIHIAHLCHSVQHNNYIDKNTIKCKMRWNAYFHANIEFWQVTKVSIYPHPLFLLHMSWYYIEWTSFSWHRTIVSPPPQ